MTGKMRKLWRDIARVAGVFPFCAGRGQETPSQMAMKKGLDLIPTDQSR